MFLLNGKLDVTKLLAICGEYDTVDENDREKVQELSIPIKKNDIEV